MSSSQSPRSPNSMSTKSSEERLRESFGDDRPLSEVREHLRSVRATSNATKGANNQPKLYCFAPQQPHETFLESVKRRMSIANLLNPIDEEPRRGVGASASASGADWNVQNGISMNAAGSTKDPAPLPICSLCTEEFRYHFQLQDHLIIVHRYPKHMCPHCHYISDQIVNMKKHVKQIHDTQSLFHCYACAFKAADHEQTKTHIRLQHSKCPYCYCAFDRLPSHERACLNRPKSLTDAGEITEEQGNLF